MYYDDHKSKNILVDEKRRWPNSTVPFYIEEDQFNSTEIQTILLAINEFHTKSCIKFRPYEENDKNWIFISGSESGKIEKLLNFFIKCFCELGCWSSIGMQDEGGQQLNVNSPKCVKKGVVMHEMLHAVGFAHQQSASNRDEYVNILWENISEGHEHNFNKYNETIVTDFGTSYDYESLMHYSGKAFSKNGKDTMTAKKLTQRLGQRNGFTETDLAKLNKMYSSPCHLSEQQQHNEDFYDFQNYDDVKNWFISLYSFT
jgi:hypothetical protein